MSYLKTLQIDSRLCIPCYVDSDISTFSIPDYVVLKIFKVRFQTMYSMLCRVWNRKKSFSDSRLCIPCYVDGEISSFLIPGYVVLKNFEPQFQTMYSMLSCVKSLSYSRLCIPCYRHSEISHFSIPDYVELSIPGYVFQTMYSHHPGHSECGKMQLWAFHHGSGTSK
jgi:hypothetical protein